MSEVPVWLFNMQTAYAVRTQVSNTCSRRVSTLSAARATNRTDVLSDTCSGGAKIFDIRIRTTSEDVMSAAVAWELAPTPGRMPSRTVRPQLRLVGPGERAFVPDTRLTRRGRLLITLVVTAAAMALAVGIATSVSAAAPQIDHATTVSPARPSPRWPPPSCRACRSTRQLPGSSWPTI